MSHFPCYPSCPLKEKCFLLNHHFFLLPSSRCFIVRVGEPISSGWPRKRRRLCRTGEDCHGSDCGTYWRTIFWTCRHDTSDTGNAKRNFSQDKSRHSSRPHCLLPIFVDPWASGLGSSWASRFHWTRVHEFIARYLTELDELPINEIFVRGFGQTLPLFFFRTMLVFLSRSISGCHHVALELCNVAKTTPILPNWAKVEAPYWIPGGFSASRRCQCLCWIGSEV